MSTSNIQKKEKPSISEQYARLYFYFYEKAPGFNLGTFIHCSK